MLLFFIENLSTCANVQQTVQQKKQQKVTGVVKDIAGDPIIGASIIEKGSSSNGTITNVNGDFSLIVTGNELQVSYIGYIPSLLHYKSLPPV